jgi:MFS family permease
MTRGQASIVGGALVGAFFTGVAVGLVGLTMEMDRRDLSVRGDERRRLADSEVRARHPPSFLAVGLVAGAGALGGALFGVVVMVVSAPMLGWRRGNFLIDGLGVLGGVLLGACVGLLLTQSLLLRRNDPWRVAIIWFSVITGAVAGAVLGGFFSGGVRGWLARRVEAPASPAAVSTKRLS